MFVRQNLVGKALLRKTALSLVLVEIFPCFGLPSSTLFFPVSGAPLNLALAIRRDLAALSWTENDDDDPRAAAPAFPELGLLSVGEALARADKNELIIREVKFFYYLRSFKI